MTAQPPNRPRTARGCPVAHGGGDLTRLYGPEAAIDPHGIYSRLRKEHGPVAPVLLEGDVPAWLVLGYRENRRVLDNPRQFSRDSRIWRDWKEGRVEDDLAADSDAGVASRLSSPRTANRTAGCAARSPTSCRTVAGRGIRRHVTHFANKQIDAFADAGSADLVAEYAEYLPMLVLTRVFGLPAERGTQPGRVLRPGDQGRRGSPRRTTTASCEILGELAERKRAEAGLRLHHRAHGAPRRSRRGRGPQPPAAGADRRAHHHQQPSGAGCCS